MASLGVANPRQIDFLRVSAVTRKLLDLNAVPRLNADYGVLIAFPIYFHEDRKSVV